MIRAARSAETLPETAIRNPSRFATTLHRPADGDEVRPACPEGDYCDEVDWNEVDVDAYRSHYDPCENPECFGGEWR